MSVLENLFRGQTAFTLQCASCKDISPTYVHTLELQLEIPSGPPFNLQHAINIHYTTQEEVEHRCAKCPHTRAMKGQKLYFAPRCLVIILRRFNPFSTKKITTDAQYPLDLDLSSSTILNSAQARYTLRSIVEHHGDSIQAGHYTATARRADKWFHFNDSTTTMLTNGTELKALSGYLFFYARNS